MDDAELGQALDYAEERLGGTPGERIVRALVAEVRKLSPPAVGGFDSIRGVILGELARVRHVDAIEIRHEESMRGYEVILRRRHPDGQQYTAAFRVSWLLNHESARRVVGICLERTLAQLDRVTPADSRNPFVANLD